MKDFEFEELYIAPPAQMIYKNDERVPLNLNNFPSL
jgi:hypothetical protein